MSTSSFSPTTVLRWFILFLNEREGAKRLLRFCTGMAVEPFFIVALPETDCET